MILNKYNDFYNGNCYNAYELFGSFKKEKGVEFILNAPNAYKVEVITSFNNWASGFMMNKIDDRGVWYFFLDNINPIYSYKYRIFKDEYNYHDKIDPFAYYSELRPSNASVMYDIDLYKFSDDEFLKNVNNSEAINIYEIHINGFMRPEWKKFASYQDLKEHLIPYIKKMGFTHIELMPLFEHPFDGSWGYQVSSAFAVTSRYGTPYELMDFINECHLNDIKVILDVVYLHFVKDTFSLTNYDHKALFEYDDNYKMFSEWDTYYFNLKNPTVMSYLMSSAFFFAKKYHIDGFRFDAVSHFIFNKGNKNLGQNDEGINFIKRLNYALKTNFPNLLLIAEDSSDFPKVTEKVEYGGLGFDYKWDLGWMNDTLKYYSMDHEYRKYHHNLMTFSMAYFYNEKFILPFSHDEVVHSKNTIINKMFGNYEEKFALCKNLFTYMFTHPGKKLNFMGNEFAQFREFDEQKELDWFMLKYPKHDTFLRFFQDLSLTYKYFKSLNSNEYSYHNFKWIMVDNNSQSVFAYYRESDEDIIVTVLNMMPISYQKYKIGVPIMGEYVEIINSEKDIYGGCNMCNFNPIFAKKEENKLHNMDYSIEIDLANFSGIMFRVNK